MTKVKQKIIIIGGGGHAKSIISVIQKTKQYQILGYINPENKGELLGVKYLGTDHDLPQLIKKTKNLAAAIGIGYVEISERRKEIFTQLKSLGFKLPAIVSPDAIVNGNVMIGDGTIVLDGVVVNVYSRIGEGCIINTNATIEHDCQIGNFVHISPGAVLSGTVKVGDFSMIGAGATVIHSKTIAAKCFIGAGGVVVKDCEKPGSYMGVPAVLK